MHLDDPLPDSASSSPRQAQPQLRQQALRWWGTEPHAARRDALIRRNVITTAIRAFFASREFIEVETSILQVSPGNETHLHAFATEAVSTDGLEVEQLYLHTSPEFACKKLLAAGEERFFTLAKVFRNRERGRLHAREFTMLEWYRAYAPLETLIEDCRALIAAAAHSINVDALVFNGKGADIAAPPQIISLAQAMSLYAGIDLLSLLDEQGAWRAEKLADAARQTGLRIADDDMAGDIFSRILVEKIEPNLGIGRLTFLTGYPMAEAALARSCEGDPRLAERFELYACGVELANAFGELTDAREQRERFSSAMDEKERIYGERFPLDEDFLAALHSMPPASGIALGFDRLVMLLTGAAYIDDVMWTP